MINWSLIGDKMNVLLSILVFGLCVLHSWGLNLGKSLCSMICKCLKVTD